MRLVPQLLRNSEDWLLLVLLRIRFSLNDKISLERTFLFKDGVINELSFAVTLGEFKVAAIGHFATSVVDGHSQNPSVVVL